MDPLAKTLGIDPMVLRKTVASLAVIASLLLLRWLVMRWVRSRVEGLEAHYRARKASTYAITVVAAITLAFIWVEAFDSLSTYLGLVSAGVAIALADLIKNMAGWAYIMLRRPFRVGDRIEIQGLKGDVVDVRLFRFSIMELGNWVDAEQATGRLVHLPNGLVFNDPLANYTEGFRHIWDEIPVLVTFESDWEKGEELINQVLADRAPDVETLAGSRIRAAARNYRIRVGPLTPSLHLTVKDSGILLTARYLVEAQRRREVQSSIWRGILESFASEPSVDLAYPTVRTYFTGPIRLESDRDE